MLCVSSLVVIDGVLILVGVMMKWCRREECRRIYRKGKWPTCALHDLAKLTDSLDGFYRIAWHVRRALILAHGVTYFSGRKLRPTIAAGRGELRDLPRSAVSDTCRRANRSGGVIYLQTCLEMPKCKSWMLSCLRRGVPTVCRVRRHLRA